MSRKRDGPTNRGEEEQNWRIKRLRQLEEKQDQKGFHFPNPVKMAKEKGEIKKLRKEIAEYEAQKQEKKKTVWLMGALVILFCIIGIMTLLKNDMSAGNGEVGGIPTPTQVTQTEPTTNPTSKPIALPAIEPATSPTTEPTEKPKATPVMEPINGVSAKDLSVWESRDFAHTAGNELTFLGDGERLMITVSAKGKELSKDDLVFLYDETLLNVEIHNKESEDNTEFEICVTGKNPCETMLALWTAYDLEQLGEEAEAWVWDIRQLDSTEGRVVYVTATGEKYHYSSDCAGESATRTILRDAEALAYEACGTCAS